MSKWRLVVFDVPDRLGALMVRLQFNPTKKNAHNWSRVFYPKRGRAEAEKVVGALRSCQIRMKWFEVKPDARIDRPFRPRSRRAA